MPPYQLGHETKRIKFQVVLLLEKFQMLRKNVKSLLERQVCIFAEIVFGVRCTLKSKRIAPVSCHLYILSQYIHVRAFVARGCIII